jgi:uncharacterized protein YgiM (DUF1202 family)
MRSFIKCLIPALLLIALTSACSSARLPEQRAQASTTPARQENSLTAAAVVKTQKANLRHAPAKAARVVATARKGEVLSLMNSMPTGSWYQVRSKSLVEGWIHGNAIDILQTTGSAVSAAQTSRPRLASPPASGRSYVNVDGVRVPSPVFSETRPAGASARCRDGSYSFSQHRRGTCSWHGGVAQWF